jgi:hypothetical protein
MLGIVNTDTDVKSIDAPNFSVNQGGNVTMAGDLTVSGDDIYMATNTAGNLLIANGTSYKPIAMSGACTITSAGVMTCSGNTVSTQYDRITAPTTNAGINLSTFNSIWTSTTGSNTWTSTTGTNTWTSGVTGGDYFTISDSGSFDASSSVLKLSRSVGNPTGGAMLAIVNSDTDVNSIQAPNFTVTQTGGIKSSSNTSGSILVANGTTFNPVVMSGSCTVSSSGVMSCTASSTPTAFDQITAPTTNGGINLASFNSTWTSTTGSNTWTASTGTNLWTNSATTGDGFTISDSATRTSGSVLKVSMPTNSTGGSALIALNNVYTSTLYEINGGNFTVDGLANVSGKTLALSGTGTPGLSTCGTSPTVAGTNAAFTVTTGSGSVGNCTATFAQPTGWTTVPTCIPGWESGQALTSTWTSTATNIIFNQNAMGSKKVDILCIGH